MDFYRVPNNIFNPISDRGLCDGRIVLPIDAKGELKDQLESAGYTDIIRAKRYLRSFRYKMVGKRCLSLTGQSL